MEKTWTYDEITKAAEERIRFWAKLANTTDYGYPPQAFNAGNAIGVFGLWSKLTEGSRPEADFLRLQELLPRPPSKEAQNIH